MLLSGAPIKTTVPFANSGAKNTIPVAASATPGLASYTTGFPALTMTPLSAGGIPPAGQDFNGILNAISQAVQYYSAGATFVYDSTFSSAVSGYPKGALLQAATAGSLWISTVDANTTNPDTGGAGWLSATAGRLINIQYITASGTYTPTVGTNSVIVEAIGAGGGGGGAPSTVSTSNYSCGGGGAAGSWGRRRYITGFSGATIVIGSAGTGVVGGSGNTGGQTSFTPTTGTAMICPGGFGGATAGPAASTQFFYGQGGAGSASSPTGADYAFRGSMGGYGTCFGGLAIGGNGAPSILGSAGGGSGGSAGQGAPDGSGSGGGGASIGAGTAAVQGGPGRPGLVIVYEYA